MLGPSAWQDSFLVDTVLMASLKVVPVVVLAPLLPITKFEQIHSEANGSQSTLSSPGQLCGKAETAARYVLPVELHSSSRDELAVATAVTSGVNLPICTLEHMTPPSRGSQSNNVQAAQSSSKNALAVLSSLAVTEQPKSTQRLNISGLSDSRVSSEKSDYC